MAKSTTSARKTRSSAEPTSQIRLRLFDGTRQPIAPNRKYLVRILDGRQHELIAKDFKGPEKLFDVPFHDNLDDRYCVLVSAKDCADVGFYPVVIAQGASVIVDLMLIPKSAEFNFAEADWDQIEADWPRAF